MWQCFLEKLKNPCSNARNVGSLLLFYHVLRSQITWGTLWCAVSMWMLCFLHLMWSCSAARGKKKMKKQTHETKFDPSDKFSLINSVSSCICLFWIMQSCRFPPFPCFFPGWRVCHGCYVIWQQGRQYTSQYFHLQDFAWFFWLLWPLQWWSYLVAECPASILWL